MRLGRVLDPTLRPCGPLSVSHETINRHVFVTGATGSGKSQTVRRLLDALTADEIPWLVIEPAKAEYARMAPRIVALGKEVTVIRPGSKDQIPASLNPLEPTSVVVGTPPRRVTFPLQTHIDLVRALFNAAFEATEPFPQILTAALSRSYEDLGWNLPLSTSFTTADGVLPRYPNLGDLQRTALQVVDGVGYGREVKDNVRGFVNVRISSLRLGTPGHFFESGHPIELDELMKQNVVFEIEDIGDDNDKAFFIGSVLIRVFELLRLKYPNAAEQLRHVLVLEEAHRLLRNATPGTPAAHAVEMFANLLAEVRAYGEGIVVAEQIPAKIVPDVVKNTALKVMHRLPAVDDREFVGATMNLDEDQSRFVVALSVGRAAVHSDGMDRPVLVQMDGSGASRERQVVPFARVPVRSMSAACPGWCQRQPCTMEDLVMSNEMTEDPKLLLWVELALVAHLIGEPMGVPNNNWVIEMKEREPHRVRCAIAQLTEHGVGARSVHIQRFYQPDLLSAHLADALFGQLKTGGPACNAEPEWQVGAFRWHDVIRALRTAPPQGVGTTSPHQSTGEWAARGLVLKGRSWPEQLAEVEQAHRRLATPYWRTFRGEPSTIEEAASKLSSADTPEARLEDAVKFLTFPTQLSFRTSRASYLTPPRVVVDVG